MITGRAAFYRGFLVDIQSYPQLGMSAYRNLEYYLDGITSYTSRPGEDIADVIDFTGDRGDFSQEEFERVAAGKQNVPVIDTCVGCGAVYPAELLMYEGVEPLVFDPRCKVCVIKHMQDQFGSENVILPTDYRN